MPNWCYTDIYINSDNQDKLNSLYALIEEWTSKNYCPNGFGKNWLGNIVGFSGIDTNENRDFNVRCRGSLIDIGICDGVINLQTETAWAPMLQMWVQIIDKYIPDAELIYSAEESGMGVYVTNDPVYDGNYYIDVWDEVKLKNGVTLESNMYASESETRDILQSLLNSNETDIESLLQLFDESDLCDHMNIHQWEYCSVDEFE